MKKTSASYQPTANCVALAVMLIITASTPSVLYYLSTTPSSSVIFSELERLTTRLESSERKHQQMQTALDVLAETLARERSEAAVEVDMTLRKSTAIDESDVSPVEDRKLGKEGGVSFD